MSGFWEYKISVESKLIKKIWNTALVNIFPYAYKKVAKVFQPGCTPSFWILNFKLISSYIRNIAITAFLPTDPPSENWFKEYNLAHLTKTEKYLVAENIFYVCYFRRKNCKVNWSKHFRQEEMLLLLPFFHLLKPTIIKQKNDYKHAYIQQHKINSVLAIWFSNWNSFEIYPESCSPIDIAQMLINTETKELFQNLFIDYLSA